jgi:hypothetical protein
VGLASLLCTLMLSVSLDMVSTLGKRRATVASSELELLTKEESTSRQKSDEEIMNAEAGMQQLPLYRDRTSSTMQ